jgi:hypothetical protein
MLLRRKLARPPSGMKKQLDSQETFVAVKQQHDDVTQSISLEDQLMRSTCGTLL